MPERLKYHFEARKGWINDPNGLIYYRGQHHAFFQYYPYATKSGQKHWGHAVSDDLISWRELEVALVPDMPYEDSGGCWSGSAIEKDGKLWLFYTSVSHGLGQTQSVAVSGDGVRFEKCALNPVSPAPPKDGSEDFRDPKVLRFKDRYLMVCGTGKDGVGKVALYESSDLLRWEYAGVLYQNAGYGPALECPDLFPLGDRYVLMFSKMGLHTHSVQFIVGGFDGCKFTPIAEQTPEGGPQFYAPQTYIDPRGRRIMIAWLYDWVRKPDPEADYAGAFTIPRELTIKNDRVSAYPVEEARHLLTAEDVLVRTTGNSVTLLHPELELKYEGDVSDVAVLRDTKTLEVFVNKGEASFSYWFGK